MMEGESAPSRHRLLWLLWVVDHLLHCPDQVPLPNLSVDVAKYEVLCSVRICRSERHQTDVSTLPPSNSLFHNGEGVVAKRVTYVAIWSHGVGYELNNANSIVGFA
jgi:hypothetical protein